MALYAEIKANGTKIDGTVTVPEGLAGMIKLHSMAFTYTQSVTAAGMVTGHRKATAVTLVTNMGPHVVLLLEALCKNQDISAKIFVDMSSKGDTKEFTVELEKARVSSFDFGLSGEGPLLGNPISFDITFPKITLTNEADGMMMMDELHQNA